MNNEFPGSNKGFISGIRGSWIIICLCKFRKNLTENVNYFSADRGRILTAEYNENRVWTEHYAHYEKKAKKRATTEMPGHCPYFESSRNYPKTTGDQSVLHRDLRRQPFALYVTANFTAKSSFNCNTLEEILKWKFGFKIEWRRCVYFMVPNRNDYQ
jgi:hypothetical protein